MQFIYNMSISAIWWNTHYIWYANSKYMKKKHISICQYISKCMHITANPFYKHIIYYIHAFRYVFTNQNVFFFIFFYIFLVFHTFNLCFDFEMQVQIEMHIYCITHRLQHIAIATINWMLKSCTNFWEKLFDEKMFEKYRNVHFWILIFSDGFVVWIVAIRSANVHFDIWHFDFFQCRNIGPRRQSVHQTPSSNEDTYTTALVAWRFDARTWQSNHKHTSATNQWYGGVCYVNWACFSHDSWHIVSTT